MPHMPVLHTPEDDLAFYTNEVFPTSEIWLTEQAGDVIGFIAFKPGWNNHLYIRPWHQSQGVGSTLLSVARRAFSPLRLWAFQCNDKARRFYEKHGFQIEQMTDGANNDERQPDILYLWERAGGTS